MSTLLEGPAYSIASCVVEAAHRLAATASSEDHYTEKRTAGRALLAAEVTAFRQLPDGVKRRRNGQGLQLVLGFYDQSGIDAVDAVEDDVIEQIGLSVGGWPWAIQLDTRLLSGSEQWLGSSFEWPEDRPNTHLDRVLKQIDRRCIIQDAGLLQLLGRRLRYRIGVDHADGSSDLFWWTTAQTEEWIARLLSGEKTNELELYVRRKFNGAVQELAHNVLGFSASIDPLFNTPDDWGFVDLERDPITVRTVGPYSQLAETHSDVSQTLAHAGDQLVVVSDRVALSERNASNPAQPYAEYLENLLSDSDYLLRRETDVIIVYRGGISREKPLSEEYCRRILDAADELVGYGVEVILGFGHGETSVHETAGRVPKVGVFEAITPTAAAAWVVKEHVNRRLIENFVDPGQPS